MNDSRSLRKRPPPSPTDSAPRKREARTRKGRATGRGGCPCSMDKCEDPTCLQHLQRPGYEGIIRRRQERMEGVARVVRREAAVPYCGLQNLGATCYINSLLQFIFLCPRLREAIYASKAVEGKGDVVSELRALMARLQVTPLSSVCPRAFVAALQVETHVQQDVEEFRKLLFTHLERGVPLSTTIPSLFAGSLRYVIECGACHRRSQGSRTEHSFYELDLGIEEVNSVQAAIFGLVGREAMVGENRYFCDHCQAKQDAQRFTEISKLPPVLFLGIRRYRYDMATFSRVKLDTSVSIPLSLDLSALVSSDSAGVTDLLEEYALVGVFSHAGEQSTSGHYTVDLRDEAGKWWAFNDDTVKARDSRYSKQSISSREAYLVVYSRLAPPSSQPQPPQDLVKALFEEDSKTLAMEEETRRGDVVDTCRVHEQTVAVFDAITARVVDMVPSQPSSSPTSSTKSPECEIIVQTPETNSAEDGTGRGEVVDLTEPALAQEDVCYVPSKWLHRWYKDPFAIESGLTFVVEGLTCQHGLVHPRKVAKTRRIPRSAWRHVARTCLLDEGVAISGVCEQCRIVLSEESFAKEHRTATIATLSSYFREQNATPSPDTPHFAVERGVVDSLAQRGQLKSRQYKLNSLIECPHGSLKPGAAVTPVEEKVWEELSALFESAVQFALPVSECVVCVELKDSAPALRTLRNQLKNEFKGVLNSLSHAHELWPSSPLETGGAAYLFPVDWLESLSTFLKATTTVALASKPLYPTMSPDLVCPHGLSVVPLLPPTHPLAHALATRVRVLPVNPAGDILRLFEKTAEGTDLPLYTYTAEDWERCSRIPSLAPLDMLPLANPPASTCCTDHTKAFISFLEQHALCWEGNHIKLKLVQPSASNLEVDGDGDVIVVDALRAPAVPRRRSRRNAASKPDVVRAAASSDTTVGDLKVQFAVSPHQCLPSQLSIHRDSLGDSPALPDEITLGIARIPPRATLFVKVSPPTEAETATETERGFQGTVLVSPHNFGTTGDVEQISLDCQIVFGDASGE